MRRQSGENTVAVADAVKAELARIRAELPPGYEMIEAIDRSRFIRSAISRRRRRPRLGRAARRGGRAALPAQRPLDADHRASPFPPSLVGSLTLFYVFGFTLNTMTLMALSLSIGGC